MYGDHRVNRLKLHELQVLLAVAQAGSMAKAAAQLAMSEPAVSRSISDMERTLGVSLFDRSSKGVRPTPYGRALIKRGVGLTPLELRSKRDTPSVRSMSEIDLETAGSDIASCAAAFAMLPACATASTTCNSWSLSRLTRWSPCMTRPIRFSYIHLKR